MSQKFLILSEDNSAEELHEILNAQLATDSDIQLTVEEDEEDTRALDPATLNVLITAGASIFSAALTSLVNLIIAHYKDKTERGNRQIVLKGKNGRELQIPADTPKEEIMEYMQMLKELEIEELKYISIEA